MGVVGEKVDDAELVRVALNGFSQPWHDFVRAVVATKNMPSWARLWDDITQEELRSSSTSTCWQKEVDEENVSLSTKGRKKKSDSSNGAKSEKDISKVKCFVCQKFGHYAKPVSQ